MKAVGFVRSLSFPEPLKLNSWVIERIDFPYFLHIQLVVKKLPDVGRTVEQRQMSSKCSQVACLIKGEQT